MEVNGSVPDRMIFLEDWTPQRSWSKARQHLLDFTPLSRSAQLNAKTWVIGPDHNTEEQYRASADTSQHKASPKQANRKLKAPIAN